MINDKKIPEKPDYYIIPPNFLETGSLFGGLIKLRNAIEAGALAVIIGLPILRLPVSFTIKIIILCVTAFPAAILAIVGIGGDSLSVFIAHFVRFIINRRVIRRSDIPEPELKAKPRHIFHRRAVDTDSDEFADDKPSPNSHDKWRVKSKKPQTIEDYLPFERVENGILHMRDGRYIKILEIEPVNFLLRSVQEQRSIIYSFASYLKIAPVNMQIKVLTRKADINRQLQAIQNEIEAEPDMRCRQQQEDYKRFIADIGTKEAVERQFFLIFEYESAYNEHRADINEIYTVLATAEQTARTYLHNTGNTVIRHANEDEFVVQALYAILNRRTSLEKPLKKRVEELVAKYTLEGRQSEINDIPVTEFVAPTQIDFTHAKYVIVDGVFHAYLYIPSNGYKPQVLAGWTSLLINAGEGIDVDMYLSRQPKERMMHKLGQQIRINKSRIRDTSDSNSDFDDLSDAIRAGYYLKDGLSNNEDFYYLSILVTVTASSLNELNWRIAEVKKLAVSQDMDIKVCSYIQEDAFRSILPVLALNKQIYTKSKRNMLTSGVSSCYPFVAYEVCDESGVLLGINKHNLSLVMVDNFDTKKYKNANFGVLGATGSGKTFVSLLLALRLRRKRTQTFIITPLKGHEAYRATRNVGGEIIKISPASPVCINIMEIRRVDRSTSEILDGTENTNSSLLSLKIQDLHIFFQLLVPDISYEEKQLLDTACIETYARFGITHDNASLEDPDNPGKYKTMPILEDLYNVLCNRPETRRIANILDRLVHGSAQSFNQQTNVDLDNPFTLLDISELSGDMLVVGFWVALSFVWDRVKEDRTVKKLLFIDELWSLIRESPLLASKVLEIFKVIRGYAGAAGFASQDLGDLFMLENGKFGRGILNACQIKIILYLEIDEARYVQDVLNLSETELMEISHFQRGNALVCANNSHIAVEVRASDLEKELITTDREELQALLDKKKVQKAM